MRALFIAYPQLSIALSVTLTLLLLTGSRAWPSVAVPPEGAVITCTGPTLLNGLFALDYLLALKGAKPVESLRPLEQERIWPDLRSLGFSGLAKNAALFFFTETLPPDSFSHYDVWQEASFGLPPIAPLELKNSLPSSCELKRAERLLVTRFAANGNFYQFDPNLRAELRKHPLQYSLTLARAWLSQFTDDSDLIHNINLLWHDPALRTDATRRARLQALLKEMSLTPKVTSSVCERTAFVSEAIKRRALKECDKVSASELTAIRDLTIVDSDRKLIRSDDFNLRKFDLAGFANLESFSAANVTWFGYALLEGFFHQSPHLKRINLRNTTASALNRWHFAGVNQLIELDLHDAHLRTIDDGTFSKLFTTDPDIETALDLGWRQDLAELTPGQLNGLTSLKKLILSGSFWLDSISSETLSKLPSLEVLDLSRTQIGSRELKLNGRELPKLKTLILSDLYSQNSWQDFSPSESLQRLDISKGHNPYFFGGFEGFPNLRELNLSGSIFYLYDLHKRLHSRDLLKLTKLEHLTLEKTVFHDDYGDGNRVAMVLEGGLPNSLRLLEICGNGIDDAWLRKSLETAWQVNPRLVVKTKTDCKGNWYELTR